MESLHSVAFLPPHKSSRVEDILCTEPPLLHQEKANPKSHMNEALIPPVHQEGLTLTLYYRAKAFSFNSEAPRNIAYCRKTAKEIKGILIDFDRWKKCTKSLKCSVDLRFCLYLHKAS